MPSLGCGMWEIKSHLPSFGVFKMKKRGLLQSLYLILCITLMCGTFLFFTQNVSAQEKVYVGNYKYTYHISGVGTYSGTRDWYRYGSNDSITTFFGTYSPLNVIERSDFKLQGSNGYIQVTDEISYSDLDHNPRKSESTWSLHLSGYQQVSWTDKYEYGNYVVLTNTATVYEETYTQRYYHNGALEETTSCHDITTVETMENITIDLGTFECVRADIESYENGNYYGHGLAWFLEDGTLIRQKQYDDSDDLIAEIVVQSLPTEGIEMDPILITSIGVSVAIAAIIIIYIVKFR